MRFQDVPRHSAPQRIAFIVALAAKIVLGQTMPSRQPAIVVTPPGFVRFDAADRSFIGLPADRPWITQSAGRVKKPLASTTQPAAMLDRLLADRHLLAATMRRDLPMLTPAQIDSYLDNRLIRLTRGLSKMGPRIVYLVASIESVKKALRDGWTDPRIHYNRDADKLEFVGPITFGQPGETDESVVGILFQPQAAENQRVNELTDMLSAVDAETSNAIASRATELMVNDWSNFIATTALAGLPSGEDQIWFKDGLSAALAAKYTAMLYGAPTSAFMPALSHNPHIMPLDAATIDLLHPLPTDQLLPQLVQRYLLARHMKQVVVMNRWLQRAGEKQIAPAVASVEKERPADGPALVKVLAASSGVDLSTDLAAR